MSSDDIHPMPHPRGFHSFLLPKYSYLLSLGRRRPQTRRILNNMSVFACFTLCLCAAAYMYDTVDDLLLEELDELKNNDSQFDSSVLEAVLEQRGILSDSNPDQSHSSILLNDTGVLNEIELALLLRRNRTSPVRDDLSISPDSSLHEALGQNNVTIEDFRYWTRSGLRSVLFANEAEFVELVEDNKDSVWLLAVLVASSDEDNGHLTQSNAGSIISSHAWGQLVNYYDDFGFKFGFLDCQRLKSLCVDRGFMAADLVLAYPVSGDRIKDSVQFRAFRRKQTHGLTLNNVHGWIASVLSDRVKKVITVDDITPASLQQPLFPLRSEWLNLRPQPVNFIWISNLSSQNNQQTIPSPLVLSSLSVSYTGRIRFWKLDRELLASSQPSKLIQMLDKVQCPYNSSNFLLITPEAKCISFGSRKSEFLNYAVLEPYLLSLYPSTDDILLTVFLLINTIRIISSGSQFGQLTGLALKIWSNRTPTTPNNTYRRSLNDSASDSRDNAGLGSWTVYPSNRSGHTRFSSRTSRSRRLQSVLSRPCLNLRLLRLAKDTAIDLITINMLTLLAALPVINFFSSPFLSCFLNAALALLRRVALSDCAAVFRSALLKQSLTWSVYAGIACALWLTLLLVNTYLHYILLTYVYRRRINRATRIPSPSTLTMDAPISDTLRHFFDRNPLLVNNDTRSRNTSSSLSSPEFDFWPTPMETSTPNTSDIIENSSNDSPPSLVTNPLDLDQRNQLLRRLQTLQATLNTSQSSDESALSDLSLLLQTYIYRWSYCLQPLFANRVADDKDDAYEAEDEGEIVESVIRNRACRRSKTNSSCHNNSWPSWVIPSDSCVICWDTYSTGVGLGALACGHAFHAQCVARWLDTGALDCPVCRWPAYAPHHRQQSHLVRHLVAALQSTIDSSSSTSLQS